MTAPVYSSARIRLHWIVAVLIVAQYVFHESIAKAWDAVLLGAEGAFDPMVAAHVLGGVVIFALVIWRLVLRARQGVPQVPQGTPGLAARFAGPAHLALYGLLILMPLSGAAAWFGGIKAAAEAHEVMRIVLLALVALHVVAALWHQFVLRDGLMTRMRQARSR